MEHTGTLYIVSTPIGNLEDITLRALRILREVDLIAAEDTRHTRKLLSAHEIHTPLTSYFDHNETQKTPKLLQRVVKGESIALVSDAGTPGISDPGYELIRAAVAQQIPVISIPGASAIITALTVSGLPFGNFLFIGFLTNKRGTRIKQLQQAQQMPYTLVCYVSPHHILNALDDIRDTLGNRKIAVARELTKKFEEVLRGTVADVQAQLAERAAIKGEFTVVIAEGDAETSRELTAGEIAAAVSACMAERQMSRKDAVKHIAATWGLSKNRVYQESLQ